MTSYIENGAASTVPDTSSGTAFPVALPLTGALPGLFALWSLPLVAFRIWSESWSGLLAKGEAEIDRSDSTAQLPVPNPLQQAKDSELFA